MVVVEGRVEELVMVASGVAVMVSLELQGGDVVLVTDETDVTALVEVTEPSLTSGMFDMVVEGEVVVVMTDIAASPPAAGLVSTERITFGSGKVDSVDRFVDIAATELSSPGAETVSEVVMEGVVIVAELVVTERLRVMDSEEVEGTESVVGDSVGILVPVMVVGKVKVGSSVVVASGTEVLLSSSVTFVGVVAAAVGLTKSVHISVSAGVTVLEGETVKLAESGVEFEIAGAVVAGGTGDGAAVGLGLVAVFVSASCIWVSSFSGVLRPDVVGGGPGLRTGFGSKAGFPADSCADTLGRI